MTRPSRGRPSPPGDGQICSLLAVDIAEFTRPDRDDDIRRYLRKGLYEMLGTGFGQSNLPWEECWHEDRGDGVLVVMPPGISVKSIIHPLPEQLRTLVRLHNHVSQYSAKIQLRVAGHIGPVEHDGEGFIGAHVNHLFRLLDARPFKNVLAASTAELALIVSNYVFENVVRGYPSLVRPEAFQPMRFQARYTRAKAWTYLPGLPALSQGSPRRCGG